VTASLGRCRRSAVLVVGRSIEDAKFMPVYDSVLPEHWSARAQVYTGLSEGPSRPFPVGDYIH